MIDIESTIFDKVATELRTKYPGIMVYGEMVQEPASFPCVNIWESQNAVVSANEDSTALANYANVGYTIQVFTNTQTKKLDGKAIAKDIDDIMIEHFRFRRTLTSQVPNIDRTIYRIEMRYIGIVKRTDYLPTESGDEVYNIIPR